ncbi:TetR/AcrR family transcriptional regulator [Gordonia jinhuaensis]|uniref:TetR-family transcriptional regulator n=1 Tax=Gordonia jinhuaensis TaxID=1517702 RepID=A0A916WQR3_9ACTN|nr:TetR/AcrR family transcriptional regulator [Gordonia jinhuaensis]GGB20740.1 putative TetR-family transcriptional regulator [Gordonia jinhuaensis]
MPTRPNPAAAARAAVAVAANATKHLPDLLGQSSSAPESTSGSDAAAPRPDGRRARWQHHKAARREELVDGVLDAVRALGADAGMDDIASHIGVSKTVLYRYFTDKNDLSTAAMARFIETTLAPRLADALTEEVDEFTLTRTTVSVYVDTVAEEPAIYNFVMSSNASTGAVADSERLVAQMLTHAMNSRLFERTFDTSGSETWSYALVGAIELATHWWMVERRVTKEQLVDYLTMMVWSSIVGVLAAGGSPEVFASMPHPLPDPPTLPNLPDSAGRVSP